MESFFIIFQWRVHLHIISSQSGLGWFFKPFWEPVFWHNWLIICLFQEHKDSQESLWVIYPGTSTMPAINDPIYSCFNTICKQQHPWSFQCRYHHSRRIDPADLPIRVLCSNVLKRLTFRFNSNDVIGNDVILKSSTCSFLWTTDPIRLEVYFDKAVNRRFLNQDFCFVADFGLILGVLI